MGSSPILPIRGSHTYVCDPFLLYLGYRGCIMNEYEEMYKKLCDRAMLKHSLLDEYKNIENGLRIGFEDIKNKETITKEEFVYYVGETCKTSVRQNDIMNKLEHILGDASIIDNVFYEFCELVVTALISKVTGLGIDVCKEEYYYILEWGLYDDKGINCEIEVDGEKHSITSVELWYDYLVSLKNK